jgi:DNA-binding response OmpR family regulator
MDAFLLVGEPSDELKRLRAHLLKQGLRPVASEMNALEQVDSEKRRFIACFWDARKQSRLSEGLSRLRSQPLAKELPLIVLIKEGQFKELLSQKGVDDFIFPPVAAEQIEHRLRFLLFRLNGSVPADETKIGALEINMERYEILLQGEPLELTYKEFELFRFLATHPGRVFNRDQLLNQVWGYNFIGGTRTVDVHVRRLRSKLGPRYSALVDTIRNVGYRFNEKLR